LFDTLADRRLNGTAARPSGGLPLALIILSLYFQRLILHHIPTQEMIVSSFLPLGPTGLAGFSLVKLGKVGLTLVPAVQTGSNKDFAVLAGGMYGAGVVGALLLWGLGVSVPTKIKHPPEGGRRADVLGL
jgi:hypothetical protein